MTETHYEKFVEHVLSGDDSELGRVKAERDYALHCLERELAIAQKSMTWERAEDALIAETSYYVVLDNGREWGDPDLNIVKGYVVRARLEPQIIRGRPEWIARVIRPGDAVSTEKQP